MLEPPLGKPYIHFMSGTRNEKKKSKKINIDQLSNVINNKFVRMIMIIAYTL